MSKARFNLKDPNSKEETLIFLIYHYNGKRFKYSTGETILPKNWNQNNQRAKELRSFPEFPELNTRLNIISNEVNNAYRFLLNEGITPTNEELRKILDRTVRFDKIESERESLFSFIEKILASQLGKRRSSTLKNYRTTYNLLASYSNSKKLNLNFDDIDLNFYDDFVKYLTIKKNLAKNTIGTHIKNIKTFLNEATERGINTNMSYKRKSFRQLKEESIKIYLNLSELDKLQELQLSKIERLDRIRDLFLIGCYTGLRFSDISQLSKEHILENSIVIKTVKTEDNLVIPINSTVRSIIEKYSYSFPRVPTNQKMNEYLKEIGKLANLNEKIQISITKGGERVKSIVPKYDLISTHTARRSFATNAYLAGIPSISIMKITGHKTENSFLKYIKISQKENADQLSNHPFFK